MPSGMTPTSTREEVVLLEVAGAATGPSGSVIFSPETPVGLAGFVFDSVGEPGRTLMPVERLVAGVTSVTHAASAATQARHTDRRMAREGVMSSGLLGRGLLGGVRARVPGIGGHLRAGVLVLL